ncbi:hypothetical protein FB446DRAFT_370019 [Lentinula raphanica]|nr:hypothetical protein FB446DRAFT_370019 [Lentinula raphanica]
MTCYSIFYAAACYSLMILSQIVPNRLVLIASTTLAVGSILLHLIYCNMPIMNDGLQRLGRSITILEENMPIYCDENQNFSQLNRIRRQQSLLNARSDILRSTDCWFFRYLSLWLLFRQVIDVWYQVSALQHRMLRDMEDQYAKELSCTKV